MDEPSTSSTASMTLAVVFASNPLGPYIRHHTYRFTFYAEERTPAIEHVLKILGDEGISVSTEIDKGVHIRPEQDFLYGLLIIALIVVVSFAFESVFWNWLYRKLEKSPPNQAPRTPASVTPAADAPVAPPLAPRLQSCDPGAEKRIRSLRLMDCNRNLEACYDSRKKAESCFLAPSGYFGGALRIVRNSRTEGDDRQL
ncbi:MAG TPA: hypothetical protein VFC29_22245 [Candidatus Limnocylindrales bacterium]|jgi:hypothetical protein|nr:hypothetical protein [Candidatus Limnocylindrales bacterium]